MTEDERQYLLRTVAEIHASLSEVALKLRLELPPKAPALKTVIKAEREIFRLKSELQRLDIEVLEQAKGRKSLPEVRRGGKVVAVDQLLQQTAIDTTSHEWGHHTKGKQSYAKSHPNGRSWLTTALSPRIILLCPVEAYANPTPSSGSLERSGDPGAFLF